MALSLTGSPCLAVERGVLDVWESSLCPKGTTMIPELATTRSRASLVFTEDLGFVVAFVNPSSSLLVTCSTAPTL